MPLEVNLSILGFMPIKNEKYADLKIFQNFKYLLINSYVMEISRLLIGIVYVLIGTYILYVLFLRKNPHQKEYERLYNEIINSDKYKVKGQFDKR